MATAAQPVGEQLKAWRARRRISQLDLALDAEISSRHLSFVETGRAQPSRAMVLRLAETLQVPPRERNRLLVAAGFAPAQPERSLDDPDLVDARRAVDLILKAHEPFPALAVDRHWNLVSANANVEHMMALVAPHLLVPPVNVLRLSLHPDGLAPRIRNLAEWRGHCIRRLEQQVDASGDAVLAALAEELRAYPGGISHVADGFGGVAVPMMFRTDSGDISFLSTTTVFGTPIDISLSELAIETFLPADAATAAYLAKPR